MAKRAYVGVSNVAKKVKKIYVGVNGIARKVKKGYVGVAGVAKLFFAGNVELSYYGQAPDATVNRGQILGGSNPAYAIFAGGFAFSPNQNYAAVDAYDTACVHYNLPDLATADSYGGAAQAGNYAVYVMWANSIAYDTELTRVNHTANSGSGYTRNQACSFQNKAVFCGGGIDTYSPVANLIKVIDSSLTVTQNIRDIVSQQELSRTASAAITSRYFAGGGWYYDSNNSRYVNLSTVMSLDESFTRSDCASLNSSGEHTAAATDSYVIFCPHNSSASTRLTVYNASGTRSFIYDASVLANVGRLGVGASLGGLAIFAGDTYVSSIDDSLTATVVPIGVQLSSAQFPSYTVATVDDKVFYASDDAPTAGEADMSVHVFRI